jgi:hypothetical protein
MGTAVAVSVSVVVLALVDGHREAIFRRYQRRRGGEGEG